MRDRALKYLRTALGSPDAEFREGQWESIEALLSRRRLLVVERTGWGKSMVYFLATRLIRDSGAGVSLLISPLLALMRNQLEAASRIGVRAKTINSTNMDDWGHIEKELRENAIDILLISPERLANDKFRENVLSYVAERVGMFVVDEAHCISDWGHDFRPDYRRIVRVLQALPSNIPVLATTATANDRVVADVISQLGEDIVLVRGPLVRQSLKLQNITMPSPAARMAWLVQTIPNLPGSGIIYTLTIKDAEWLTEWLRSNNIDAEAYHSDVKGDVDETISPLRERLEQKLLKNELKVLVATVALGMGFDKPDLGFVIHFQRPSSVVHYYQQVGRAGRAVDEAYGILMCGEEDDSIADYFIRRAFPPQTHVDAILAELDKAENGMSVNDLQKKLNLKKSNLDNALKYLSVEMPAPITKIGSKYNLTAAGEGYRVDTARVQQITGIRRKEQAEMQCYMKHTGCLMEFLSRALDDPYSEPCRKCSGCLGRPLLSPDLDEGLVNRAAIFIKRSHQPLNPRRQWPSGGALPIYGFTGRIGENLCAEEGRALCIWRDAGWGQMVYAGKYENDRFDDELVKACVEMIGTWHPDPPPEWVTCIPSLNHPRLVTDFSRRLALELGLPFKPSLEKNKATRPQKEMENSFQQAHNLDGVFAVIADDMPTAPCLLVDDMADSKWTITVAAAVLRRAGCTAVIPLALALNSPSID